ncbi:deoxyguanosinetriphosphate triphosphohydrolase-like protein [Clostridia bacterium]|nr:deoxyguanosinetriphosphate triphosphohydrolase-like protein [Clostridia bacterium]
MISQTSQTSRSIRAKLEQEERARLSPHAMLSEATAGRVFPITPDDLRTEFQRDRDRILHSKSFRRLKDKTQMIVIPRGDHYRTRLTHTLEVAQVARTIARALRLNEDLTEAIAYGHDLGHTPFGHMGERTLDRVYPPGFRHNEQSLRTVELLEREGVGLNLTQETRDGILCHSGDCQPKTLECWCVRFADRIAYVNHDIDDSIRAGLLKQADLPGELITALGESHGERIARMVGDVVNESEDQPTLRMSPEIQEASDALRSFLFERVYRAEWALREETKIDGLMESLYSRFVADPRLLPPEFHARALYETVERSAVDYLAGMTDRFALDRYRRLFMPNVNF